MKYLVKTLSAWTTFEDLILDELELQQYKEYARDQQLLLEVSDIDLLNKKQKEKDKKELMDKQQLKLNFN